MQLSEHKGVESRGSREATSKQIINKLNEPLHANSQCTI